MGSYHWNQPERRDLYLAARILAGPEDAGEWRQWASETLIQDLELYSDPRQGTGSWLAKDEEALAIELGERLWRVVQIDLFSAAELLAKADPSLSAVARKLIEQMESNGRTIG